MNNLMNNLEVAYLGLTEYQKAEHLQYDLHQLVKEKPIHAIIGLEHPSVLTLGHRCQDVLYGEDVGLPVVRSSRGGLLTIHSEGQLVIYPIVNLKSIGWGAKTYVAKLLQTTQKLLAEFRIQSFIDEKNVGLYTTEGKIAFCGLQIKNGVSLHGISLNVRNDLSLFQSIKSCGVEKARLDRLQNYKVDLTLEELFSKWVSLFRKAMHESSIKP